MTDITEDWSDIAPCMVCLGDDEDTMRVCNANHRVCAGCAGRIVRDFASDPADGRVRCPAGKCGACEGHAETDLVVLALAAGGEDAKEDITTLVAALTSVAEGPAEKRGRAEGAEAARKEAIDMSKVESTVRKIREDALCERCPRCKKVFDEWDGCNALTCPSCGCAFCAVCLEDCGSDAHAHVAREHGGLFDRATVLRARDGRRREAVTRELDALSKVARDRAADQLAGDLFDLGLGPAPHAARHDAKDCSPAQFARRAARYVAELEELMEHFKSGKASSFEPVNTRMVVVDEQTGDRMPKEAVNLIWDGSFNRHRVVVSVNDPDFSTQQKAAREKELEMSMSQMCFVKGDFGPDARVYTLTSKDRLKSVTYVTIEPDGFARMRDIEVKFYQSVGREFSALTSCKRLVEQPDDAAKVLKVLMRMEPNERVLTSSADDALSAHVTAHSHLNEQQRGVFHPDEIRTVQLVHGPPGTGKTSVIDTYLQSPACKPTWLEGARRRHVVLVVSEKNHAVDAIAASLLRRGGGEPGNIVWEETTAHGVVDSLGNSSKKFFAEAKAKDDPSVTAADRGIIAADVLVKNASRALLKIVNANKDCVIAAAGMVGATWKDISIPDKNEQHISVSKVRSFSFYMRRYLGTKSFSPTARFQHLITSPFSTDR
jgi:hypothetical protein